MSTRSTFEGREVVGSQVKLVAAAADVSDPDPYQVGDSVFVVCEAVIDRIEHQAVKDSDKLIRVARARTIVGAVVEQQLVAEAIELARINREASEGVLRLGFDGA